MYFLALEISQAWSQWIWPILQFLIGLGVVIVSHELGHFIAAKLMGIKVERFSIGFGPRLCGFKKGETDYRLSAVPLGGYVGMLGQEDFGKQEHKSDDPRSFMNKSVGARFIVIAAGVVMNVILAGVLFILVCLVGIDFVAPVVGDVVEGKAATRAQITWLDKPPPADAEGDHRIGLKPGDRIIRINSREVNRFQKLRMAGIRDRNRDVHEIIFRREIDGRQYTGQAKIEIKEKDRGSELGGVTYGIVQPWMPVFDATKKYKPLGKFRPGDRIVSINGRKIRHGWDLVEIQKNLDGAPVTVAIERESNNGVDEKVTLRPAISGGKLRDVLFLKTNDDARRVYGEILRWGKEVVVFRTEQGQVREYPKKDIDRVGKEELLEVLGMVPRIQVGAVTKDAPADKAGLEPGDIIISLADEPRPTYREMLDLCEKFAGKKTNITVLRNGQKITRQIQPSRRKELIGVQVRADVTHMVVAGIRDDSPAADAGIRNGDVIEKINDRPVDTWVSMINVLEDLGGEDITVHYSRAGVPAVAELGRLTDEVFDADDYRYSLFDSTLPFESLKVTIRKTNPLAAVAWGAGEVLNFITLQYITLQMLITGEVGTGGVAGPVGIGSMAVSVSRESMVMFVYFMGMISVIVAVINFLPFPVLDGGHAVLLIIEKITGRPPPARVVTIIWTVGLFLLLGLFVALMWHDISRLIGGMW